MGEIWRIIDTGLRSAPQNIALSRALLEARQADEIPSTLRFLRFTPSALLGSNQSADQEFDLDYCRANNIAVQRRITGGGGIYTNESQLDWELYLHRRDVGSTDMRAVAKRVCHAAAAAVSALGIDARFRPRNDVEADGRKILSGGGVCEASALLYQGTLLIDLDIGEMLRVLRLPVRQASDAATALARGRFASLKDLLGHRVDSVLIRRYLTEAFESEFEVEFRESDLTLTEYARYRTALAEIDTVDWVDLVKRAATDAPLYEAIHEIRAGKLRVSLIYDRPRHRIKHIWFDGNTAMTPHRTIADLEAALQDTSVERLDHNVRMFFAGRRVADTLLTPDDFIAVTRLAAKQPIVAPSRA